MKLTMQRATWVLLIVTVFGIVASYAVVAATTYIRPPTVVVTFNIEQVVADLTEKADAETRLRALINKITDEREKRINAIETLRETIDSVAEADRLVLVEELEQKTLAAMSYQRFATLQIDDERSLMLRDLYIKIRKAVAEIAEENGYDIVLISDVDREATFNPQSKVSREQQILERIGAQRAMYASSETDITEQIVTHMNLDWEKRTDN